MQWRITGLCHLYFGIIFIFTFMLAIPVWLGENKGRATNEPFESGIVPAAVHVFVFCKIYLIAMFS